MSFNKVAMKVNTLTICLTLFRMGFFGAAHGCGGGAKRPSLHKICHTYLTMMEFGSYTLPKEDSKNI